MFEVALNAVVHAATGIAPHRVLFGLDTRVPSTFLSEELQSTLPQEEREKVDVPAKLRRWFRECQGVWKLVHEKQTAADQHAKEVYDKNRKNSLIPGRRLSAVVH